MHVRKKGENEWKKVGHNFSKREIKMFYNAMATMI